MSEEIRKSVEMPIAKIDTESRMIYGVVYKASKEFDENGNPTDYEDTQGNWAKAEAIKKACHSFNKKLQNRKVAFKGGVDKQHNEIAGYGIVVESYIAKVAEPEINADVGDWVAAIEVTDDTCWSLVEKKEIVNFPTGNINKQFCYVFTGIVVRCIGFIIGEFKIGIFTINFIFFCCLVI